MVDIEVVVLLLVNVHLEVAHIVLGLGHENQHVSVLDNQVIEIDLVPFLLHGDIRILGVVGMVREALETAKEGCFWQ